jgi:hypothetical protein
MRNLAGLDGCGFVLELQNGQRLEPAGEAWQRVTKTDGAKVMVTYSEESRGSICMVGKTVNVSCIRVVSGGNSQGQ